MPRGQYDRSKSKRRGVPIDQAVPRSLAIAAARHAECVNLSVEVPTGGAEIKLIKGKYLIGTLHLTQEGLAFAPPKAKVNGRRCGYKQLAALFKSGLLH